MGPSYSIGGKMKSANCAFRGLLQQNLASPHNEEVVFCYPVRPWNVITKLFQVRRMRRNPVSADFENQAVSLPGYLRQNLTAAAIQLIVSQSRAARPKK
ncbi:MAG: hypothetical protein K9G33_13975 [Sneathiella sp.]|nr:hypothetical protein [Sneathiella sp.]